MASNDPNAGDESAPDRKWWIERSAPKSEGKSGRLSSLAGARFYRAAEGYEQERARSGLVDLNQKLLNEGAPSEGDYAYLNPIDEQSSAEAIEGIKRSVPLPPGARAVIVDAGQMARIILTGTPVGERILEFNFNQGSPSFDAWVRGEWREEILFRSLSELRHQAPDLVQDYLGKDAKYESELLG